MKRLIPVRVGLVLLAVIYVVFNSICTVRGGQPASDAVVLALLGLIATAITGDTFRPSGVVRGEASGGNPENVKAALERLAAEAARRRAAVARPAPAPTADEEPTGPAGPRIRIPPVPAPGGEGA